MHELGYTRDIIYTVLAEAEKANANEVRKVYLTIGEARDIVDDLFLNCFEHFARNTMAEKAEVIITRLPFTVRCKECGFLYRIDARDETTLSCPCCKEKDYALSTGAEFYISKIEVA